MSSFVVVLRRKTARGCREVEQKGTAGPSTHSYSKCAKYRTTLGTD